MSAIQDELPATCSKCSYPLLKVMRRKKGQPAVFKCRRCGFEMKILDKEAAAPLCQESADIIGKTTGPQWMASMLGYMKEE